ncbi:hypothetical protein F4814DRAFT_423507 [Daldinia grandis]|nr:hypothetical protein F4814DRAFT_423507 [Daldinia grandis]
MDSQIIHIADGRAGLAAQEHLQQSVSQSCAPGYSTSNIPILDPHNFSNLTLEASPPSQPSHVSPSMLETLVPTKTRLFPLFSTPYWSLIEFPVKEAILKVLSDSLGSFQEACRTLELFSNEVREFLRKRNSLEPASSMLKEEPIAYGCKYLCSRGLEKHSELLKEYARCINEWPLDIDVSDLNLELLPESLEYKEPIVEFLPYQHRDSQARRFHNSTAERVLSLSAESIAISVRIMKSAFPDTCKFFSTVDTFRLPAGVVIVSPGGTKELLEGGKYTIINPPLPAFSELHQFIICDNAPKHPMSLIADFPTSQSQTHLGYEEANQPSRPCSTDSSDSQLHTHSATGFFDDMVSYRTRAVERALEDSLIPHGSLVDKASSISLRPKLVLQPRKDAKCLLPGTGDQLARELYQKGHKALLHFYLPAGYSVISPSGYRMNFDTPHISDSNGESLPGRGGEYIVIPPEHAVHADNYRRVTLAKSEIAWINLKESAAVLRDGKMLPRIVGTGLHRLSIRDDGLKITCEDGEYDLTKALRNPDPYPLFTIKSVPIYTTDTTSKEAVATHPTGNDATQYLAQNNAETEEGNEEDSPYSPSNTATSALIGALQDRKRKQPYDAIEELPRKIPKTGPLIRPLGQSETLETLETQGEGKSQIIQPNPLIEDHPQALPRPMFRHENKTQLKGRLNARPVAQKQHIFSGVTTGNAAGLVRNMALQKSSTVPPPGATTRGEVLAQPQVKEQTQPKVEKKRPVRFILTNRKGATPATPQAQPNTGSSSSFNTGRTSVGYSQVQTQAQRPVQAQAQAQGYAQAQAQTQAQIQYPAKPQVGRRPRGRPPKNRQQIATSTNPHRVQPAAAPSLPIVNRPSLIVTLQARPRTEFPPSRKTAQGHASLPPRRSSRLNGARENPGTQPGK